MAQNTNKKELRQQALRALAEGRVEISAEVHHVRLQLSPARVMQRVFNRHTGVIVSLALAAGLIPALLIFRGKQTPHPVTESAAKSVPKPMLGALLVSTLGILAKSVTPALIKSTILPQVLDFLSRKQPRAAAGGPEVPPDV